MSWLLTDPDGVVVVAADNERVESLRPALLAGDASSVTVADDTADALAELQARDDIGCVVVTDGLVGEDVVECCRELADGDPRPSVVVVAEAGSEGLAHEVNAAGGSRYVPASAGDDAVTRAVDEALEEFKHRRNVVADHSMFQTLLEEVRRPIYAKDTEGRHVRMSYVPQGFDPEGAIGKTDPELFEHLTEQANDTYRDDLKVIESESPIREREEVLDLWDVTLVQETTKVPWYGPDGELAGLVGLTIDVSDRRDLELYLDQRDKEFETFASYVSHDLANPLAVARGYLEQALDSGDPEAIETAVEAIDRVEEMLEDLTELARTGQGVDADDGAAPDVPVEDPVDVADVATAIWEVVQERDASLDVALPPGAHVHASASSLRPILENLFKNAIDHGPDDVTVTVGATDRDGLYVEDDGLGIPEDRRDEVFDRGFTTAADGSGTGLSIVTQTADQLGWSCDLATAPRGGARFEFHRCSLVTDPDPDVAPREPVQLEDGVDVGDTRVDGSFTADHETGEIEVLGGGNDIWGGRNEFHFAYATVEQPVRIQGRIPHLDDVHEYAKAGFMVRSSRDQDAAYGCVARGPTDGLETLWRTDRGGFGLSDSPEQVEVGEYPWYRLDCIDGSVTLSVSADGEDWHAVDQRMVDLDDEVAVGCIVSSHMPGVTATGRFADVTVTRLST